MDKREFVKQVYETVWGSNARPRQFIIDGIKKETYTYDETIEKIEAIIIENNRLENYAEENGNRIIRNEHVKQA